MMQSVMEQIKTTKSPEELVKLEGIYQQLAQHLPLSARDMEAAFQEAWQAASIKIDDATIAKIEAQWAAPAVRGGDTAASTLTIDPRSLAVMTAQTTAATATYVLRFDHLTSTLQSDNAATLSELRAIRQVLQTGTYVQVAVAGAVDMTVNGNDAGSVPLTDDFGGRTIRARGRRA